MLCLVLCSVQELAVDYVSDAVEGAADVAPHCSWRTLTSGRGFCFPQSAWQWLPVPAQDQDKLTISFQEAHGLPIDGLYEENSGFIKLPLPITETVSTPNIQAHTHTHTHTHTTSCVRHLSCKRQHETGVCGCTLAQLLRHKNLQICSALLHVLTIIDHAVPFGMCSAHRWLTRSHV